MGRPIENPNPPPPDAEPGEFRGADDEQYAAILARRGLFTEWRVALADAIAKAILAHPDDPDAAATQAAEQVAERVGDAVDDTAEALGADVLDRIEQRMKTEKTRRPVAPNVRRSSGGAS